MSTQDKVPIRHEVLCGDHTPGGYTKEFSFSHQAPAAICYPLVFSPLPSFNVDAKTNEFVSKVSTTRSKEIMASRTWICLGCGGPAESLAHALSPRLSESTPTLTDYAAPFCNSRPDCQLNAVGKVTKFLKENLGKAALKKPSAGNVDVRYWVLCGDPRPGGFSKHLEFMIQAPAAVCVPSTTDGPKEDKETVTNLIRTMAKIYNRDILRSHSWTCVGCGSPAKELIHALCPALSDNKENPKADFMPTVFNNAVPICISGGNCDRKASQILETYLGDMTNKAKPGEKFTFGNNLCNRCGKLDPDNKFCDGCKMYRYCSKKCQKEAWPYHKAQCRNAQAEQAAKKL